MKTLKTWSKGKKIEENSSYSSFLFPFFIRRRRIFEFFEIRKIGKCRVILNARRDLINLCFSLRFSRFRAKLWKLCSKRGTRKGRSRIIRVILSSFFFFIRRRRINLRFELFEVRKIGKYRIIFNA